MLLKMQEKKRQLTEGVDWSAAKTKTAKTPRNKALSALAIGELGNNFIIAIEERKGVAAATSSEKRRDRFAGKTAAELQRERVFPRNL